MPLPATTAEIIQSLDDRADLAFWINEALNAEVADSHEQQAPLSELEQRIAGLLAAIDVACEDTAMQLERIINDVSRGVPRLIYDVHFMEDAAVALQASLSSVNDESDTVPEATAVALEQLRHLDTVKRHMEAARNVLREAESWSTLEAEVTSLLAEKNYTKAAERLSEASRSVIVFEKTPEYESRQTLLVSLQNQLEASLSSALVAAITSQDLTICRDYFAIFSNIQRESEFRNYYNGSRRAALVALWQSVQLAEGDPASSASASTVQTFSGFLPRFYANFLSLLDAERNRIPSIFPDPSLSFSTLIFSVSSALQPTLSQRLAAVISHYGASGLQDLIVAFKATEDFVLKAEQVIDKVRQASPQSSPNSPKIESLTNSRILHKKNSKRMSVSWRVAAPRHSVSGFGVPTTSEDLDWDFEFFQPFVDFQMDYGNLESRLLDEKLNEIVTSGVALRDLDQPRLLRDSVVDLCRAADEAIVRCLEFTYGYAAVGLVQAVDTFFKSFMDMWTADLIMQRSLTVSHQPSKPGDDLSDLDYTEQDWAAFQFFIDLLASARTASERMNAFEANLISALARVAPMLRLGHSSPMQASLPGMVGAAQLLAQSTLNSAELYAILSIAESEPTIPSPRLDGMQTPLLVDARAAVSSFAKACQVSLQDTILSPLRRHLAMYPSLPHWSAPKSKLASPFELLVPSFSLSPTDVMQRVAEGLLNLPRLFEVHAEDDARAFSLQTLPHVDAALFNRAPLPEQPETQPTHARRASLIAKPTSLSPSHMAQPLTSEAVSAAWLSSLGHAVAAHFTGNVLPTVRALTPAATAQLAADLGYLANIVRALNVDHPELDGLRELVEMDEEEGRRRAAETDIASDKIFTLVASIRGWRT